MKEAAEKLGFQAQARVLGIDELRALGGYAILPLGNAAQMQAKHESFALIAGHSMDKAMVLDANSLSIREMPLSYLNGLWDGEALVISADPLGNRLLRPLMQDFVNSGTPNDKGVITLGGIEVGSKLSTHIVLAQQDDSPDWRVLSKSCHCIEAGVYRVGKGTVMLSVRFHVTQGGPYLGRITVASKSAGIRKDYAFRMFGQNAHRIRPAAGYLEVEKGHAEYPVSIEYYPSKPDIAVTFDRIDSSIPNVECGSAVLKERIDGGVKIITIAATLVYTVTDATREELRKGTVNFHLNTSIGKWSVPFDFSIRSGKSPLKIVPEKLLVVCSRSASTDTHASVRVEVQTAENAVELFVESDPDLPAQISQCRISEKEYRVSVVVTPAKLQSVPPGVCSGRIAVGAKGAGDTSRVVLPVMIIVRD